VDPPDKATKTASFPPHDTLQSLGNPMTAIPKKAMKGVKGRKKGKEGEPEKTA
jgi:hypothetical protein